MSDLGDVLAGLTEFQHSRELVVAAISAEDARHVLHHYGHPDGWQPGTFTERLISAAVYADAANLNRLGAGFPGIAAAVKLMQYDPQGVDTLRRISGALA